MTIQAIDGDDVTCIWFDKTTRKEAKFHAETIEDPNEGAMKKASELLEKYSKNVTLEAGAAAR